MSTPRSGAPRGPSGRFRNTRVNDAHDGAPMWKFLRNMRTQPWTRPHFERAGNDPAWLAENREATTFTWIGHATWLVQCAGLNLLFDPVMSRRTSPVQWAGPKRLAPLGLEFDELPRIDLVLVSHNHYDHLDRDTVLALHRRDAPRFIAPLGLKRWFSNLGINQADELDWWQQTTHGSLAVHAVPAQHFSGRGLRDRNRSLWCGFVVESPKQRLYFAGDTGYGPDFADIGERFAPIDVSMIPIGAYDPRSFMRPVHVDPEEAVRIHQDTGSTLSLGMHWGTFRLTLEPLDEPPGRLQRALASAGIPAAHFRCLAHGETLRL